jgi:DNA mismatch endonuclease (patch repair protein)
MSRIRGQDTLPERLVREALATRGLQWEEQARDLPGRPDFVFRDCWVAVFVDGDFWHGWRFPLWRDKLSEPWERKIAANRARDQRNQRRLRKDGWKVIRLWEHQIQGNLPRAMARIIEALGPKA